MCMELFPEYHSFSSLWLLMSIQGPWTPMAMITSAEISSSTYTRKSSSFSPALPCASWFPMVLLCSFRVGVKKGAPEHNLSNTVFRDIFVHVPIPCFWHFRKDSSCSSAGEVVLRGHQDLPQLRGGTVCGGSDLPGSTGKVCRTCLGCLGHVEQPS